MMLSVMAAPTQQKYLVDANRHQTGHFCNRVINMPYFNIQIFLICSLIFNLIQIIVHLPFPFSNFSVLSLFLPFFG